MQYIIPAFPGFHVIRPWHDTPGCYMEPIIGWLIETEVSPVKKIPFVVFPTPITVHGSESSDNYGVKCPDGRINTFDRVFTDDADFEDWARLPSDHEEK